MIARIWIILLIFIIMLTGCWDKIELDKRTFVLGAALDTAPEKDNPHKSEFDGKDLPDLYMLTLETPITKQMTGGGGGESSSQSKKAAMVSTGVGTSFFQIIRNKASESDRILFFGQQDVLIIGEELVAQQDLGRILDFWSRDPEVDRSVKVFVARGDGKDIFNADSKNSQTVSASIKDESEQNEKTSHFINMDLIEVLSNLAEGSNFLIGSIAFSSDKNLRLSGSAVIKDGKLKGWLNEIETHASQFVMGEVKGGELVVQDPEHENSFITIEFSHVKTQVNADIQDSTPYFTINVDLKCNIAEINSASKKIDEKTIARIEQAASATLEKQIRETIEKLQKQYKADVLGFGENLNKHHNKDWKQIKQKWDKLYPEVPVSIKVQTKVRRIGRTY